MITLPRLLLCAFACCLFAVTARAANADTASLPNPLKRVKPGQWVVYRMNTLFGSAEQKQTVQDVQGEGDDRVFTIKTEMTIEGELVDERTDSITYRQALAEQEKALADVGDVQITNTQINVKGVPLDAVEVSFVQDDSKCTLYLSEQIPLVGMIRMEVQDMEDPAMELVDFGE